MYCLQLYFLEITLNSTSATIFSIFNFGRRFNIRLFATVIIMTRNPQVWFEIPMVKLKRKKEQASYLNITKEEGEEKIKGAR